MAGFCAESFFFFEPDSWQGQFLPHDPFFGGNFFSELGEMDFFFRALPDLSPPSKAGEEFLCPVRLVALINLS